MSEDETVKELDSYPEGTDEEAAHSEAEGVILAYLRSIGEARVADAFERCRDRVGFWYA